MKTSFYFILWILIYPLLGLLHNNFVNENAFFFALIISWGFASLIKNTIPGIIMYNRLATVYPILEDVYTGNVDSFGRWLKRMFFINLVSALYFVLVTITMIYSVFYDGMGSNFIILLIFLFFALVRITGCINTGKNISMYRVDPTPGCCREIAEERFHLDYGSYYYERQEKSYPGMFPEIPSGYKAYLIISIIFGGISALLGLVFVILGIINMLSVMRYSYVAASLFSVYFLYGSLALYYGITDIISLSRTMAMNKLIKESYNNI